VIQLHREIFSLHLDFENLPQTPNCLVPAERQERNFLPGIISRGKERKALDVVPVKVGERDNDLFLLVADGAKVSAQISQSRARVNMAMRFVSVNVICRQVVLPSNCWKRASQMGMDPRVP
jgi:hypothetical protein